jgi:hypothetical protein
MIFKLKAFLFEEEDLAVLSDEQAARTDPHDGPDKSIKVVPPPSENLQTPDDEDIVFVASIEA